MPQAKANTFLSKRNAVVEMQLIAYPKFVLKRSCLFCYLVHCLFICFEQR